MITVLPTSVPAVQKTFTVSLTSASNNVAISTTAGTLSLVVSQYGNPYGVISFIGNNLIPLIVNELDTTVNTFALTLVRTGIITDAATVTFIVSGNAVSQSVSPTSGSVTFQPGSSQVQISLGVLPDGVPELDNTYTVTLTSATGPATIDALGSVATFIIPYATLVHITLWSPDSILCSCDHTSHCGHVTMHTSHCGHVTMHTSHTNT